MPCRRHDIRMFDGMRCCIACGETVTEFNPEVNLTLHNAHSLPYKYARLNYELGQEIRLIVLQPGQHSDDIVVDIIHVNLTDEPSYEAISYAWATENGDASLSQTVHCSGKEVLVTENCGGALRCFRKADRKRRLWIDAICIDQDNTSERNHQVAFMGSIYSNASQVLIYLGPGTDFTKKMLDYLKSDAEACPVLHPSKDCVADFLRLRWFDRVWVIQEIALARLVVLFAGDRSVHWTSESVDKVLNLCSILRIQPPSTLFWLPASEPEADLLSVLHRSRNCSSTDPRDKVFAMLGLVQQDIRDALPVDYSTAVQEVFTKLATFLIEDKKDLAVLKHATGQFLNLPAGLGTWIPSWDVKISHNPLPAQFDSSELRLLASTWFTPELPHEVRLYGSISSDILNDALKMVPTDESAMPTAAWRHWLSLWSEEKSFPTQRLTAEELENLALALAQARDRDFNFSVIPADAKAFRELLPRRSLQGSRTPLLRVRAHRLDFFHTNCFVPSSDQAKSFFHKSLPMYCCGLCKEHFNQEPICQQNPSVASAMAAELDLTYHRIGQAQSGSLGSLFLTAQSIGFANAVLLDHDEIWALPGMDVPFVLRRREQYFQLVCECYLFGALKPHLCACCGDEVEPWAMTTEIIDI